jgi:hypothetical protein
MIKMSPEPAFEEEPICRDGKKEIRFEHRMLDGSQDSKEAVIQVRIEALL